MGGQSIGHSFVYPQESLHTYWLQTCWCFFDRVDPLAMCLRKTVSVYSCEGICLNDISVLLLAREMSRTSVCWKVFPPRNETSISNNNISVVGCSLWGICSGDIQLVHVVDPCLAFWESSTVVSTVAAPVHAPPIGGPFAPERLLSLKKNIIYK